MGASCLFLSDTLRAFLDILFLKKNTKIKYAMPSPQKRKVKYHKRSVWILGGLISRIIYAVKLLINHYTFCSSLPTLTSSSVGETGLAIKSLAPSSNALSTFSSFPAEEIMMMGTLDPNSFLT